MDANTFYLIGIVILFLLAISDLIVGVSNDAVNFLNAAVGSKAATFKTIMIFAAVGVFVGAVFSTGMMEVARKGIFNPSYFTFHEVMIIFIAVMLTDVIMLDLFNTFGLPTSTTVSLVFELLGAAVALSITKLIHDPNAISIGEYINSSKALAIISGILISVVIAFTVGLIVQYIVRFAFTFDYKKNLKYFGGIFGGISVAGITYFILVKGAKDAAFMTEEVVSWIGSHSFLIIGASFICWTILFQLIYFIFKTNILKFIVLIGTFALGLAFAGNDLVNFIGVPIAGYTSYLDFIKYNNGTNATDFLMTNMAGKVPTPPYMLLIAGIVMVTTLILSRKAKNVIKTSVDLGNQSDNEEEKFSPSLFSSALVRNISKGFNILYRAIPIKTRAKIQSRFDQKPFKEESKLLGVQAPSFDLVRASVTLMLSAILISAGTNLKLPLSTTYVTFMVFMGASLADGAWGRESAVYRVSGVLSVIGGWFITAMLAFLASLTLAFIIYYTEFYGLLVLILLASYLIYQTYSSFNRKQKEKLELDDDLGLHLVHKEKNYGEYILEKTIKLSSNLNSETSQIISETLEGLAKENLKNIQKAQELNDIWYNKTKKLKGKIKNVVEKLPAEQVFAGNQYVRVVENLRDEYYAVQNIINPVKQYILNFHKPLSKIQMKHLEKINEEFKLFQELVVPAFKHADENIIANIKQKRNQLLDLLEDTRKEHLKNVKKGEVGVRNSILFINIINEFKNLLLLGYSLTKIMHEFKKELNLHNKDK